MKKKATLAALGGALLICALSGPGCVTDVEDPPTARVVSKDGKTFIVDKTGKHWDVTHAVREYGFVAAEFQFGLGPNAIKPIVSPAMLSPGEPGYSNIGDDRIVIGTTIVGQSRAYPIDVLNRHEIADETFIDQDSSEVHVAVGW